MKVKAKLFATLRKDKFNESELEVNDSLNILSLVKSIGLDQKEIAIIFVNGKHADFNTILHDGDEIAFFPPIGGG